MWEIPTKAIYLSIEALKLNSRLQLELADMAKSLAVTNKPVLDSGLMLQRRGPLLGPSES